MGPEFQDLVAGIFADLDYFPVSSLWIWFPGLETGFALDYAHRQSAHASGGDRAAPTSRRPRPVDAPVVRD
jgi:hypothetical protein